MISILGYEQFNCEEYYSEYQALEINRHTVLSDKFCLKYYELPKLPEITDVQAEKAAELADYKAAIADYKAEIAALKALVADKQ